MTTDRNKLLELAKEAGAFEGLADDDMIFPGGSDALERFAALVLSAAQAEREPVGEVMDTPDDIGTYVDLGEQLAPGTKLYVTPPSSDQVWNESAEHAAHQWETAHGFDKHGVAAFIRSLKRPSQAQEQECETCEGKGHYDERIGGESFSNPKADCPDCDGKGWNAKADVSASGAGDERVMTAPVPARPILYTDTVSGEQCCRDDMWAVTTAELNALSRAKQAAQSAQVSEWSLRSQIEISNALRVQLEEMQKHHAEVTVPALLEERCNRDKARIITGNMPLATLQATEQPEDDLARFEAWHLEWRKTTWHPLPSDFQRGRAEMPEHWNTFSRNDMLTGWQAAKRDAAQAPQERAAVPQEVHDLIAWLLGENGEFPARPEKIEGRLQPLYWWRTELRKRWDALLNLAQSKDKP